MAFFAKNWAAVVIAVILFIGVIMSPSIVTDLFQGCQGIMDTARDMPSLVP